MTAVNLELQLPSSLIVMTSTPLTQLLPISSNSAPLSYKLLVGTWPILEDFPPVSEHVMTRIKTDASGTAISNNLQHLSLGLFFIDTDLLMPHSTQRPVNQHHVKELREGFEKFGIHRMDSPGVVIGLGDGWLQMKNNGPNCYKISKTSPHVHLLAAEPGGPIAHIIRGGHRTEAIRNYSRYPDNTNFSQNFWMYHVLVPGLSNFIFLSSMSLLIGLYIK